MASDHDLLVATHTMVQDLHQEIMGNGRQGMKADVAVLQDDVADLKSAKVPDHSSHKLPTIAATVVALLAAITARVVL